MKSTTTPGLNRTGLAASPQDAGKMLEVTELTRPSSPGLAEDALVTRRLYAKEAPAPHGTMPPPASLKEAASVTFKALAGQKATVLIDKLGERLAFERAGTRLYEGLLAKFDVFGTWDGGPTRAQLERIHRDEHDHFLLVKGFIERLGSDPTTVTPSANVHAVASMGIVKVISDPRMNLQESIEAIAVAELADNDCWSNLVQLLRGTGHEELADQAEEALESERDHLRLVRDWIAAALASTGALGPMRPALRRTLRQGKRAGPNQSMRKQLQGAKAKAKTAKPTGKQLQAKQKGTARKTVISRAKSASAGGKKKVARRASASAKQVRRR